MIATFSSIINPFLTSGDYPFVSENLCGLFYYGLKNLASGEIQKQWRKVVNKNIKLLDLQR